MLPNSTAEMQLRTNYSTPSPVMQAQLRTNYATPSPVMQANLYSEMTTHLRTVATAMKTHTYVSIALASHMQNSADCIASST